MRTSSVLVPRSTSHESIGPRIAPAAFCTNRIHSTSSSCFTTTMPPTLSLWPLRNFVVLCDDDVGAEQQRLLDVGAGEGVVHDDADAVPVGDLAGRGQVGDPQQRDWSAISRNRYFVRGVIAGSIRSRFEEST